MNQFLKAENMKTTAIRRVTDMTTWLIFQSFEETQREPNTASVEREEMHHYKTGETNLWMPKRRLPHAR